MREEKHEERLATSGVWGALHGKSVREQMLSPWFIFITLLTALQMLRMNFFIATISSQYEYMLGSKGLAREVNAFFDIALPVRKSSLLFPITGDLADWLTDWWSCRDAVHRPSTRPCEHRDAPRRSRRTHHCGRRLWLLAIPLGSVCQCRSVRLVETAILLSYVVRVPHNRRVTSC